MRSPVKELVEGVLRSFVLWASRNGFSCEYGDVLELAKSYGLKFTCKFLVGYPNTSKAILEFVKDLVEERRRRAKA